MEARRKASASYTLKETASATTGVSNPPVAKMHAIWIFQFMVCLRVDDLQNHEKKPADPRLEVEDVFILTLHKNNIELPDAFYSVNANFRPKLPPKK